MSNLNLATTGKYLTPKERAKLVIALQLRILTETTPEEREKQRESQWGLLSSPEDREIKELLNSCPPHQGRDYNFYIDLKQYVWEHITDELRNHLITLELMNGMIAPLRYLMGIAPFISEGIDQLKRLPVVVLKDEYDKAVVVGREYERSQVIELDGDYDLAKQEAYYYLISEKKIGEGDFEGYIHYMGNYGTSKDELIKQRVISMKKDIAIFEKRKSRMGGDLPMSDYVRPHIGLSDAEMVTKIGKAYEGHFDIPSKEEHEVWVQTVNEERKRLQDVLENGILKPQGKGVEAGSYYDWKDRRQKFAGDEGAGDRHWNPLDASCMEIGFSEGKVVPSSLAKTGDWHTIIAASVHNKDSMGYAGDSFGQKRLDGIIALFSSLAPFTQSEKQFDKEERTITVRLDAHKKLLCDFATNAQAELQAITNKIALIHAIENAYFDGMSIVVAGVNVKLLTVEGVKLRALLVASDHNSKIRDVITDYNRLCHGFWDYRLIDIDSYLLNPEPKVNDEWVAHELERVGQKLHSG